MCGSSQQNDRRSGTLLPESTLKDVVANLQILVSTKCQVFWDQYKKNPKIQKKIFRMKNVS